MIRYVIRSAPTLCTFKNRLKTHSFLQSYFSFINLIRVAYVVRCPCSDSTDMLRRLINCRIIIIIIIYYAVTLTFDPLTLKVRGTSSIT